MIKEAWARLLNVFYRRLMNRENLAPAMSGHEICCVPGCGMTASEQWMPSVCALREAGVDIDWAPVCTEHDIQMNEAITRLVFGSRYDDELAAYARRRRHNEGP